MRILLLGSDDVEEQGRSDTMMVLFLNPELKRAALLSIPRDLRVSVPGHGRDKICHAYHFGGIELAKETVEQFLDLHIDYYAQVGFEAFEEVMDILGGVDIEVPDIEGGGRGMIKRTYYKNIRLKPGYQHLDGSQALQFVRYRNDSDFKRADRQQQLLRAIVDQKLNVMMAPQLINAAGTVLQNLEHDIEFAPAIALMRIIQQIPASEIMTVVVPAADAPDNGKYYAEVRTTAFRELMVEMGRYLDGQAAPGMLVEVRNGSGRTGAAATAADILSEAGLEIGGVSNADGFAYSRTIINYRPTAQETAHKAKDALKLSDAEMIEKRIWQDDPELEVVIVLGQDFEPSATRVQ